MIALDTNVLVRFLVVDDKAQSAKAARLVERTVASNETLFVSDVVICETVRVLLSAYQNFASGGRRYPRPAAESDAPQLPGRRRPGARS